MQSPCVEIGAFCVLKKFEKMVFKVDFRAGAVLGLFLVPVVHEDVLAVSQRDQAGVAVPDREEGDAVFHDGFSVK